MKYLLNRSDYIKEAVLHEHYEDRLKERLDPSNVWIDIRGVKDEKTEDIKTSIINKIKGNIELLKMDKYYPLDDTVRVIKTAQVKIRKDNKDLDIKIKTKSKNIKGKESTYEGTVYWSICINNVLNTIIIADENEDDTFLYNKTRQHLRYKGFPEYPILVLNNEIQTSVYIHLDKDDNVQPDTNTNYIDTVSTQMGLVPKKNNNKGTILNHIGLLVNPESDKLEIIKDENGKPVKDYKTSEIEDIVTLKGISINKDTKEVVKDGIKVLFTDRTQKTFKNGDTIKIGNKVATINKIFLDKRKDNPVNFMFKSA